MIVFDLKCTSNGHVFEGWFGSSTDYEDQKARGLLTCPVCGDASVDKAVMAPAVSAKSNQRSSNPVAVREEPVAQVPSSALAVSTPPSPADAAKMQALLTAMAKVQAEILEKSTWVGRDFADKARAMHYGEEDAAPIHGEVAPDEARALIEEGVEVASLPLPYIPPEAQN